jgi:hypothetical protein
MSKPRVIKLFAVVALVTAGTACEQAEATQQRQLQNEAQPAPPSSHAIPTAQPTPPAPGVSVRPRLLRNGRPAPGNVTSRVAPRELR